MFEGKNEQQARQEIKEAVAEYYRQYLEKKEDFRPGQRIAYAARVFDEKEMCALTDAMLDFWLTAGRFADRFEKEFADSVFDRLFMMEDSRNSAMLGNGLGLTIAKNLALQLGGDITLESHPHQKTVFTITLKKMAY